MTLETVNPATGEVLESYQEADAGEIGAAIVAADAAFRNWRRTPLEERASHLRRVAELLRERSGTYADLMAAEMGKPVSEGRTEVEKCAWVCDYYAQNGASFLATQEIDTDATRSFVVCEPLGVVLAVMPWNFPFWQVFRFAAPALMAGNAAVLKHASNVPGCALAIEDVWRRARLPDDLFRTLLVGSSGVAAIIEHPLVRAVTLTGSTPAGREVAAKAGREIKKTVLELGGSDPYVVLADADVEAAASACATSRMINGGQSCIAAKRFIVVASQKESFESLLSLKMGETVMGDPRDGETTLGPQARRELRDDLHRQVRESVELGARVLLGGEVPDGPGAYYPPTVLTDVVKGMPAFDEELFGPVAAIVEARDESEAILLANDTPFGLGAAVFTRDENRGCEIASRELEAGSCFVNTFVRSDPRLPFGGIKGSGYGRELSAEGIREFVNVKTVYLA